MATKTERERVRLERAGQDRNKAAHAGPPKRPRQISRRSTSAVTATKEQGEVERRVGSGSSGARNRSRAAGKHATHALEDSSTGRPTRKSTRASQNRAKTDTELRRRQMRRNRSPETVARRAAVRATPAG